MAALTLLSAACNRLDLADDVNTIGILFHHPDNTAHVAGGDL